MGSILQLYLNRTKRSGSCLDEPVSNNDDDQNPTNDKRNSVNQLMLKENCQQSDNQLLGMLCRLNEIDEQLEKFQIQRRIDNGNTSQILSSLRSTEEENKVLFENTYEIMFYHNVLHYIDTVCVCDIICYEFKSH